MSPQEQPGEELKLTLLNLCIVLYEHVRDV